MHTQVARLQSTSAGRDTLARLGHNVSVLPPLPQQSPPWECISLTDAKPLPRNMGSDQEARRRAYAKRHGKWLRCLKDHSSGGEKSHVFYTDAACIRHLPNFATAWVNEDGTSQGRKLHITKEPGHSTGAELHAILDLIKHLSFQRGSEDRSLKNAYHVFTDSQEAYRACDDSRHTSTVVSYLRQCISGLRTLGHDFTVHWIPGHSGIPGNEKANRLARALLQSAQSGRPSSDDDIEHETETPPTSYDPREAIVQAKKYRREYLTSAHNPLGIPPLPGLVFSRRQQVTIRQVQSGTLLTPFLLQRFRRPQNAGSSRHSLGSCDTCLVRADLEHLLWACPLYSLPRARALASLRPEVRPTSLRAWACPDSSTPVATAVELWRALDEFLLDPAAPPTGSRLLAIGHTT